MEINNNKKNYETNGTHTGTKPKMCFVCRYRGGKRETGNREKTARQGKSDGAPPWNSDESREVKRLMRFSEFTVLREESAFYTDVLRVLAVRKYAIDFYR